jgi:hypothetical protein
MQRIYGMQKFRLIGHFGGFVLLFIFYAGSAASAAPSLLPGTAGTTFTGKSGKLTWQTKGGGAISCSASEVVNGEIVSTALLLFLFRFTGCTLAGLAENTLGDASGVTLVHVEADFCAISNKPLVGGLLFKVLPVHLEVPSTKLLLVLEGSFVGTMSPENKKAFAFTPTFTQKEGKQTVEGCLNEAGTKLEPEMLLWSADGGTFVQTALEFKELSFTFASEQEFMT